MVKRWTSYEDVYSSDTGALVLYSDYAMLEKHYEQAAAAIRAYAEIRDKLEVQAAASNAALDWTMAVIAKEWTAEGADLLLPDEGELASTLRASLVRVTRQLI